MRIYLHIGPQHMGAARLHQVLDAKRAQLKDQGVLFPKSPGAKNHTRLYMAVSDPDHIDPLRFNRGFIAPEKQETLYHMLGRTLAQDVEKASPETLILSAEQLGSSLHRRSELERLRALLTPLSQDIRIIAHVDEPARALTRAYGGQMLEGRAAPLSRDLDLAASGRDWWAASLEAAPAPDPAGGQFLETQAPSFWLDYGALVRFWESVFGAGSVTLRPYDPGLFYGPDATEELRAAFDIAPDLGKVDPVPMPVAPSAPWLTRARQLNALLLRVLEHHKRILPRPLWRGFLDEIAIDGPPIAPGALAPISARFAADLETLGAAHPALTPMVLHPDAPLPDWQEPDPERGYRASQYLASFMEQIDAVSKDEHATKHADLAQVDGQSPTAEPDGLSDTGRRVMPPLAVEKFHHLKTTPYAPHNRLGTVDEETPAAPYAPAPRRTLAEGSSGNVIVGCMKNEAPYIIEWVAYHRAIGVDNFLIYTNDCTDGTDEILGRLQDMGVLEHRNNDEWRGKSPQQHALNMSLKEPVLRNAEWLMHIDVDEFVNVRCGNGTLQDFFDAAPEATNVAMTWRLFGHSGVTQLEDRFVVGQFDRCAPTYCPKPHTVWGFKTLFRNIGAYQKLSCHRPNKLEDAKRDQVLWVNGSGQDITKETVDNGWRSSKSSVGYDLLQLNHYALRSAESFLIKRQRGRALHVDRSIGLNYWIRMDWDDARDVTIQRNLPRLKVEYDKLMADDRLRSLHDKGLAWHRAKAAELHAMQEFQDLYRQALEIRLTGTERAAYALALDLES
ncbi:glycosyltransferase family 2 protein [Antarcticimicrobium sediminis]|uniref:Glycosyltransferase family 2 protein n=1 Tax=Antarcticimicrobium sediminis TaxID=2546227 RepID=A0A4R5F0K9_9RHOB|nr:glycosyltransferase family 2 protein [Antarcticimicrobium sediminis]TDE40792.1 glycosyltransferase family 2 protein [Antarcticimicrobium sediminis]